MGTINIRVADAGPLVRDVMLVGPETLPPTATVADARALFESPRQKLALVADGDRYVGAVTRESIEGADATTPLGELTPAEVATLDPDEPFDHAVELGVSRTPVVTSDGALAGLVCFNRTAGTFCVAD